MTKVADAKPKNRPTRPSRGKRVAARKPRRLTAAQKIIHASTGWAGDDLEEIIALVEKTRSRTRF